MVNVSSQYGVADWSAQQALGPPNTNAYGDNKTAWAPLNENNTDESITVGFSQPVFATGALIRETFGNGFVKEIYVVEADGTTRLVWQGPDTTPTNQLGELTTAWAPNDRLVKGLKIVVDTRAATTWEEIDAIRIFGRP